MVTSPQDLAGMVVRKAAQMATQMSVPVLGLVENMSYATCPKCGERLEVFGPSQAAATAQYIGTPLLGTLPLDSELAVHCDAGTIEDYAATEFEPVASQVVAASQKQPVNGLSSPRSLPSWRACRRYYAWRINTTAKWRLPAGVCSKI